MIGAGMMLFALIVDMIVGWPKALFDAIGHPVTWLGKMISRLDDWLNLEGTDARDRRIAGLAAALLVIFFTFALAAMVQMLMPSGLLGVVLTGIVAWPLVAAKSLSDHVKAVIEPLRDGDLTRARQAVSMIVGRDPAFLDEAGISRATLESLAENASDGVVAPLFWGALLGLPGIAAYKAINTLDSMIGHRTPRHEAFGWAAAKIDDLVNFIPARLTGLIFCALAPQKREAVGLMLREARNHRSPNAGWPEAAAAAALDVRLSGPRSYGDGVRDEPWINGSAHDPDAGDIERGLRLFRTSLAAIAALLAILWLI
ncbi:MAG: adenosylcobinamide-phosphate synthase CbiB [Paracoccaceae bacterium]